MRPGKIPALVVCAAMLALLAACTGGRDAAAVPPEPTPSALAVDTQDSPLILHEPEQDSPEPSEEPGEEAVEEPLEEPVKEPAGEPNPIPFFVPDPDPNDPNPTPVPVPEHDSIPIPYIKTEDALPAVSQKTSDPDKFADSDLYEENAPYFGRWSIQSVGIDVACYLGISQEVVDAQDAATFFQYGDQYVIGDHSNQDFWCLSSCRPGDLACLETEGGIAIYVCTAVIEGHNTQDSITDDVGNPIEYGFNPGGVTCYTCNDNWQNIHIVLFSPIG